MIEYLLIDFSFKSTLPETLIYTSSLLSTKYKVKNQKIFKIYNNKTLSDLLEIAVKEIDKRAIIILWQQDWLNSKGGFLLIDCAQKLKRILPESSIIVAGYLPTMSPGLFLDEHYFDFVMVGYPWACTEWLNLEKHTEDKKIECYHLSGFPEELSLKEGMEFVEDMDSVFKKTADGKIVSTYNTTYHCNNRCPFCFNSRFAEYGGGIIKSRNKITDEIEYLINEHNVSYIKSKDNNIFVDLKSGQNILRYFINSKRVSIIGNMDVMVKDFSKDNIDLLSKIGVTCIFFGLETTKKDVMEKLNKDFSLKNLEENFRYGEGKGIFFLGNILLGVDKSLEDPLTKSDIDNEKEVITYLLRRHSNLSIQLRLFTPLLGTPLGDKIWSETEGYERVDLKSYLNLIDTLVNSKKFDSKRILPSCYESEEIVNYAAGISNSLRLLNSSRAMYHSFKRKNHFIRNVLDLRQKTLRYAFDKRLYKLIKLENYGVGLAKTAYAKFRY